MAGNYLKGALISFMPTFVGSQPNAIVFQFNPETISHAWTPAGKSSHATDPKAAVNPMAADAIPGESFTLKISLDANEMIANAATNPVAAALASDSGVYSYLSALEMLQYPSGAFSGASLLGTVSASISAAGINVSISASSSTQTASVPRSEVPTVLFIWGPHRIVPVRVTALSITETLYDDLLNPIHADVNITLRVLTPDELAAVTGDMQQIAMVAYTYSQSFRQAQAALNLGNAAASSIGVLPGPL